MAPYGPASSRPVLTSPQRAAALFEACELSVTALDLNSLLYSTCMYSTPVHKLLSVYSYSYTLAARTNTVQM